MATRTDVALEEYKQLRGEILVHIQAQTTLVSIALTATAAIGAVAFATEANGVDRLEILLILPIVLCGIGLRYLAHSHGCHLIGHYIRQRLWDQLQKTSRNGSDIYIYSWEASRHGLRGATAALTPSGYLSGLPGFFIFGVPSIAALIINGNAAPSWISVFNWNPEGGELSDAWAIDALAVIVSAGLMAWVGLTASSEPFPPIETAEAAAPKPGGSAHTHS